MCGSGFRADLINRWHSGAPLPDDTLRCQQENIYEAYVSAQYPASSQEARLSQADADSRWARNYFGPPSEGSRPIVGLIGRLHQRDDFRLLAREGLTVRRGPLRVRFRSVKGRIDDPSVRVAYAIPRIVGSAVERNRIRRRLRALIVDLYRRRQGVPFGDYLIRVSPGAANLSYEEMQQYLTDAIDSFLKVD